MSKSLWHLLVSLRLRVVGVAAVSAVAAGLVWAQTASFSGPSITRVAEPATFNGGALPPNAALTVFVTAPGGSTSGFGVVSSAAGSLQYDFSANQLGTYTLTLTDSGGRALASAIIAVLP
jgi:hypothetical protein